MSSKKKLDVEQCKRLLKMSVTRLKIHRNKKIELSKVMNREIADMLAKNKDEMARIKVMQLIYLDYLIEVLNLVEVYAETIHARAQVLMFSPHCPDELRKEIASIIYASPFIENEEMIKVRALFVQQYGKSFPEHCLQAVDPALVARLKRDQPDSALINYYLSTIAKRHNIDWALPSLETVSSMPTVTTHVTFVTQQPSAPPSVPAPVPTFPATPAAGSPYGVPTSPYGQVQQPTSFPSFPSVPSPTSSQSPSASLFPSHPPSFFPPPPSSSVPSSAGFPPPPSVSAFPSFPASTSSLPPPQASRPPTDDDFMARLSALGSFSAAAPPPATSHSTSSLPSPSFPQQPSLTSSPAASPFGPPPTVPSAGPFGPTRPLGPSSPGPFGPASTGHASTPAAPSPYSLTANLDSLFPSAGSASSLFPSAPGNLPPDLGSYGQPQPASHTASLSSSALSPPADLGSYGMPASMADLGSYGLPAAPATTTTTAATAKTPSPASAGGDDLDTLWSQTTALSARSSVMLPTLGQSFLEATGHSVKVGGADSSARSDFNLAAARKVVLDLGSGFSKAGFAGETQPRSVFHSVVGTPFYEGRGGASGPDSSFVGNQAQSQRSLLNLTRPIRGGIVRDWSGFERLFSHAFTAELLVDPSTSPVLVAEAPLPSKADRETLLQLLFEKLNVPAVYLASQPVLALHSSGRRSGVVLDCGHDSTYAVPIYEGKCIHHAIQRMDFAGSHLSLQTLQLLQRAGVSLIPGSETEIAQDVKEKVGYAAFDFSQDIQLAALDPTQINRAYTMPDGQVIQLGSERFSLSEPLFSPMLLQSGATPSTAASGGLQDLVFKAVVNSPTEARRALLSNVVLTGGTCLLPGLSERLEKELNLQAPAGVAVHVVAPPNLQFSAWIGGAMLASTQTTGWLTRQQYLESGPTIVHKAFPLDPSN